MKVYLGGVRGDASWRNRIKPMLTVDYFDPIGSDPEEDFNQHESCDIILHIITPGNCKDFSVDEMREVIEEVIQDSETFPEKTIVSIIKYDDGLSFSIEQYDYISESFHTMSKNGSTVFPFINDAIEKINSLS